jgi:hypothetical protein
MNNKELEDTITKSNVSTTEWLGLWENADLFELLKHSLIAY